MTSQPDTRFGADTEKTARPTATELLDAARKYLARGMRAVPIPPDKRGRRQKGPRLEGWQSLRLGEADLPQHFQEGYNIGLLAGGASGNLVDVDLDCTEALALADHFLPSTSMIHGRPETPRSHRWYQTDAPASTEQFEGTPAPGVKKRAMLVELRGTGAQTMVPPSIHPETEERLEWVSPDGAPGEPARVSLSDLRRGVRRLAAAALAVRGWHKGVRHGAALALAGLLATGGWSQEEAVAFVTAIAASANDDDLHEREREVLDTFARHDEHQTVMGRLRLVKLWGKDVVGKLERWLELRGENRLIDSPYEVCNNAIYMMKFKHNALTRERLSNFVAKVVGEITLDDDVETSCAFMIEGTLSTGEPLAAVRVPSTKFGSMTWLAEMWGLRPIVGAGLGTRDRLREAIQCLSPNVERRRVFTHTGWREIEGKYAYLLGDGSVCRDGVEVELGSPDLARYRLPREVVDACEAMRESLKLWDLAPEVVTVPLWSAMFVAPLASAHPLDLSIALEGPTGSLKSTLAAVFLCHYGDFGRTTLPGAWSSTANHLEKRAFILKDLPFVVDDYAPSAYSARDLQTKAERLFRSQGNRTGRGRLRSDLTDRPAYWPRGIIVSTGEQHPSGASLLARLLLIKLARNQVKLEKLTKAQAASGRLAHALAGYIRWLAPQMPKIAEEAARLFGTAREKATHADEHLRVPEALANLSLGIEFGMRYAEAVGACTHDEGMAYRHRTWAALLLLGKAQGELVEHERPSRRFLSVLLNLVTQGRGVLLRGDHPGGYTRGPVLLGWQDNASLYLLPEGAYQAVVRFCRDSDEPFSASQSRLRDDLVLEKLSEKGQDGRHTPVVRVGGSTRRVLRLNRAAVEKLLDEPFPEPPDDKRLADEDF